MSLLSRFKRNCPLNRGRVPQQGPAVRYGAHPGGIYSAAPANHRGILDKIVYQIEESRQGDNFLAFCPELVITAFGDTPEDARSSLRSEIADYLEDCEKLGILDDVLIDAGFYDNDEVWMSSLVTPPKEPRINFL